MDLSSLLTPDKPTTLKPPSTESNLGFLSSFTDKALIPTKDEKKDKVEDDGKKAERFK